MSRRPNLAALTSAAGSVHARIVPEPQEAAPAPVRAEAPQAGSAAKAKKREGLTQIAGHFPAPVRVQLKMLAAEKSRTVEDMLAEALNDLFAKYGRPELAPTARNR